MNCHKNREDEEGIWEDSKRGLGRSNNNRRTARQRLYTMCLSARGEKEVGERGRERGSV